ncbi:DinB family protein [Fulvivirga lutea]|uniref:DinB family protein n=1 Tax=Fulvivirga lutea TaxID=2810512 RepID=A0A975A2J0_9BACT|nr:DinB family protein [Fulvivirga lutea]QSE98592.1 DinB family protein [Fulvivirga lutea]
MKLTEACKEILKQLDSVINSIKDEDFAKPIPSLNNSTIGQHVRHTLEFFTCLISSCKNGAVNYDKRDHDAVIEQDRTVAEAVIADIINFLDDAPSNIQLTLVANYNLYDEENTAIETNLYRELAYNIEHAIHHMALIKVGLKEIASYISLPSNFGVAVSTIKFQQAQVAK